MEGRREGVKGRTVWKEGARGRKEQGRGKVKNEMIRKEEKRRRRK